MILLAETTFVEASVGAEGEEDGFKKLGNNSNDSNGYN